MTNPNPLYPKLLDILRVSLVEFGDKATPELRGRTFIDGIFLYHGANKSGAKIIAILTPEGLRIPVPLPAIAKISIIGRSPSGDFIEDLGIRADAPFRLVNFYGMNPDIKPPPNQPPYIPPKDAYTIVSDVNTDTKTVTFDFPETDIEPITISVASGLPDDVPFLFLENLETLDIGGEDYADEGIDEVIELEEEGAYGTIVVQN
jgi:hypothetical protein